MNQPYTVRRGWSWNARGAYFDVRTEQTPAHQEPALVVTGDLDAAEKALANGAHPLVTITIDGKPTPGDLDALRDAIARRLAPIDDAAIERAAKAAYDADRKLHGASAVRWHALYAHERDRWRDIARAALAAAEETTT